MRIGSIRICGLALSLSVAVSVAPFCFAQKRPMTFEDMMQMKRLGETAVSPDGKWLAYSVTTVDLAANTKTAELWVQAISGGEPFKLAVAQPGDSGPQFSSDGKRILFLSAYEGGKQQVYMADFDPATGAATNRKRVTIYLDRGRQRAVVPGRQIHRLYFRCVSRTAQRSISTTSTPATPAT